MTSADNSSINGDAGNDFISVNDGEYSYINGGDGNDTINNYSSNVSINGGEGNNYIVNDASNVTINSGDGDNRIEIGASTGGGDIENILINVGDGNDSIYNDGDNAVINAGGGNDTISNDGVNVTINGGAGDDKIFSYYSYEDNKLVIDGGAGDDSIYNDERTNVSILGGAGNDFVSLGSNAYRDILVKYNVGDGNDTIQGFNSGATLQIGGGSDTYSTQASGSDIIVTVGDGSILLKGAANLSKVNIKGKEEKIEENSWKLNGTTATYGTSSNTLITINGVKSLAGITLSDKTVTVANSALNQGTVKISNGYTLKLGNDVTQSKTTAAGWSLNGTTATYKAASTSAGYKLANNQVSYVNASGGNTLVTVSGVKSLSGITLSDKTVTIANSALNQGAVSISDGYTLKLGNDVPISSTTAAGWSLNGTTATYKIAATSAGYKLANNQISYVNASGGNTLVTVSGVKSLSGISLSDKTVTIANSALNQGTVKISDGYTLKLGNDVPISSTTAASWTLNGTTATYKAASTSAGYKLANNQISYVNASGGSTLVTVSGVKSLSGITLSDKTVTVANSALNQGTVKISDGYTLALGNDVTQSKTTAAGWTLNGTTATYKAASTSAGYKLANNQISYVKASGGNTLVTVSGVKSLSGITLSDKTVTIANSALNQGTVKISDGYTLKLGNDVTQSKTTAAGWTLNGTTATYKAASTSAGYKLANNQISYVNASGGNTLVTVSGIKSTNGLSIDTNAKTVTVANSALNQGTVKISNGYTLKLGNADIPKTVKASWKLNGKTATYNSDSTTAGYTLAADGKSIVYSSEKAATILATINGVKSTDDLSIQKNTIKPSASALSGNVSVSSDKYGFEFTSDYKKAKISGFKFDETITTSWQYMTIDGGAGEDIISVSGKYTSINGYNGDKYVAIGTNASKSTVQTGGGNDTVSNKAKGALIDSKGGKDQIVNTGANVTIDSGASNDTITNSGAGVLISGGDGADSIISSGANVTINGGKGNDFISAGGDSMISVPGSNGADFLVTHKPYEDSSIDGGAGDDTIIGGYGSDTIIGGKGNDSLAGNDGADIFIYNLGDGNDTITDYATEDRISIASGTAVTSTSGNNFILTVGQGRQKRNNNHSERQKQSGYLLRYERRARLSRRRFNR
ncbi:MAG: hypothetical protein IJK81_05930 [Selenomonadaceae bacterium]|nr:hypothetical protein [Selenomonadaceae bacterium]